MLYSPELRGAEESECVTVKSIKYQVLKFLGSGLAYNIINFLKTFKLFYLEDKNMVNEAFLMMTIKSVP